MLSEASGKLKLGFVGLFKSTHPGNNHRVIVSQRARWRGNLAVKYTDFYELPAKS